MKNNVKVLLAKRLSMLLFFMVVALVSGCQMMLRPGPDAVALKFRETAMKILNDPKGINRKNVNRQNTSMQVTPLAAAILFAPDRVGEMIEKGADVNRVVVHPPWTFWYGNNYRIDYTVLAIDRSYWLKMNWNIDADPDLDLVVTETLLGAGADVDGRPGAGNSTPFGRAVLSWKRGEVELAKKKMRTLGLKYDAPVNLQYSYVRRLAEENPYKYEQLWEYYKALYDTRNNTNNLSLDKKNEYFSNILISESEMNEKKAAIDNEIRKDKELKSVFDSVVSVGKSCKTASRFSSKVYEFACENPINGQYFVSKGCESFKKPLYAQVNGDSKKICGIYRDQKNQFASSMRRNADVMKSLIEDKVEKSGLDEKLANIYSGEISHMRSIKEREVRGERVAMDRASRQRMNNLMNYMQNSFTSTTQADQIVQRSVKNTQQQLYLRANNQKMNEINANLKELDKKLDSIDRQVSEKASSSGNPGKSSANAGASPSIRVCAGPFTVPAMNQVFSIAEQNSGKTDVDYQCPAGSSPVLEGRYSIDGEYGN